VSTLYLYLHTHWDREWYLPAQGFRLNLFKVATTLADALETGLLPSFSLDGQSIVCEDIAEVDPELALRLAKLVSAGKLSIGPWYVLADQMLVSGESLIRNLATGIKLARRYGGSAAIGYCPDTFGHSQDLPRILSGFGIRVAVVWRGVPVLSDPAFRWTSPCGSSVTAYHLTRGYYQSIFHENWPADKLAAALATWLSCEGENARAYCALTTGALHPVGCDHLGAPLGIGEKLSAVRKYLDENKPDWSYDLSITPLAEYLSAVDRAVRAGAELQEIRGELRDNSQAKHYANAYLLPGVLSTRLYLKRENRLAEHRLFSICEPLFSLLSAGSVMPYPENELDYATRLLLRNHPHDSICGCSVDRVHAEMQARTGQLNDLLDALLGAADGALAAKSCPAAQLSPLDPDFGADRLLVYNLSGQEVSCPVRIKFNSNLNDSLPDSGSLQLIETSERDELFGGGSIVPYYKPVRMNEAWVWAEAVPPLGFRASVLPPPEPLSPAVAVSHRCLSNGLLAVSVTAAGELLVRQKIAGADRQYLLKHVLRDAGDGGDTYNYDPLADDAFIFARLTSVEPGACGPLVCSLLLHYEIDIPESLAPSAPAPYAVRSTKVLKHEIVTEVSLKRAVPLVFFDTRWQNYSCDHRLEVVLDSGEPVRSTYSENHFSLVARHHPEEVTALPVPAACEAKPLSYPCQRFFIANEQVFLNCGLPEYSVDGSSVTITLLRAVSILSRGAIRTRGGGAGPHLSVPGANSLGANQTSYGWAPLAHAPAGDTGLEGAWLPDGQVALAYRLAELFSGCLHATLVRGGEVDARSFFKLSNPAVTVTALQSVQGSYMLRLLNPTRSRTGCRLTIDFPVAAVERVALDGSALERLELEAVSAGSYAATVSFGENELVGLRIEPA
jgi:hypothetical protein